MVATVVETQVKSLNLLEVSPKVFLPYEHPRTDPLGILLERRSFPFAVPLEFQKTSECFSFF